MVNIVVRFVLAALAVAFCASIARSEATTWPDGKKIMTGSFTDQTGAGWVAPEFPDTAHRIKGAFRFEPIGANSDGTRIRYKLTSGAGVVPGKIEAFPTQPGASTLLGEGRIIVYGPNSSGYIRNGETFDLIPNTDYRIRFCFDDSGITPVYGPEIEPVPNSQGFPYFKLRSAALTRTAQKTFSNPTAVRVRVQVWDGEIGGDRLTEFWLEPGETTQKTFTTDSGKDLNVQYEWEDGDGDPNTVSTAFDRVINTEMKAIVAGADNTPVDAGTSDVAKVGGITSRGVVTTGGGISVQTTTTTNAAGGLTEGTYTKGTNNITGAIKSAGDATVNALSRIEQKLGTSGSGGTGGGNVTVDMTTTNAKLDTLHADLTKGGDGAAQQGVASWSGSEKGTAALTEAQGYGTTGKTNAEQSFVTHGLAAPSTENVAVGAAPSGVIQLQVNSNTTIEIPRNPFAASGPFGGVLLTVATFIRQLIAWGLVAGFFWWFLEEVRGVIRSGMSTTPLSAHIADAINSVKIVGTGGGLGYAAQIAAFAVVAAFVVTLPVAVMAAATAGIPFTSLVGTFVAGPPAASGGGAGTLQSAIGLADQVIPWVMCITTPVYAFVVRLVLIPSEFFWQLFFKFLPT